MTEPSSQPTPEPRRAAADPAETTSPVNPVEGAPEFLPASDPAAQPGAPAGYQAPAADYQVPAAADPAYQAPGAPQAYPPAVGQYPAADPAAPVAAPVPVGPENVGRGVLFSLLAIVLGAVLAVVLYQLGFIASITSFAMAWAAGWLYTKGAGAPPRKGVVPLIVVIVVGVIVSLIAMPAWALYSGLAAQNPDAGFGEIMPYVLQLLPNPELWQAFGMNSLIFVAFAALGTFSTLRQLSRNATPTA